MIKALNTKRNRELSLLKLEIDVLYKKNGIVYFKVIKDGKDVFLKSEEGFFAANFTMPLNWPDEQEKMPEINKKNCKDYLTVKSLG